MSTTAPVVPDSSPIVLEKAEIRSWKAPIAFGVFVLISIILFFGFSRHGESTFRLSEKSDAIALPTSAVTFQPGSSSSSWRNPERTMGWSSTRTIRSVDIDPARAPFGKPGH